MVVGQFVRTSSKGDLKVKRPLRRFPNRETLCGHPTSQIRRPERKCVVAMDSLGGHGRQTPPTDAEERPLLLKRSTSNSSATRHRAEPSMNDLALLMREQDADLLESIHFSTANESGETPLLTHVAPATDTLPELRLETIDGGDSAVKHHHQHHRSQRSFTRQLGAREGSRGELGGDEGPEMIMTRTRRALSGEVWTADRAASFSSHHNDPELVAALLEEEAKPVDEEDVQRGMTRSESMDRRLNEAAQFAEAVGELRPAEQDGLRIIEEDRDDLDDDDDDDDEAPEVHVTVHEPVIEPSTARVLHRQKSRPQWPYTKRGFMDKLPDNSDCQDFVYKGIHSNPPEIVKRGTNRGNYAQLHRKAWLEVSDKYHRYGKNLRLYYRYWERLGCPTNMFFDWLDSKGEAAGQPLPNLEDCPRSELDSDTVLYIHNDEVTQGYALSFVIDEETGRGRVYDVDGDAVKTGADGWIFVLRDNVIYGAQKVTSVKGHSKQRFHHSSFFGGKAVAAAGIFLTDEEGYLTRLYPHSGHYRPGEAHMQRMLFFLHNAGVNLSTFDMDMQQILHVARDTPKDGEGEKKKKTESLRLVPGVLVACYLAHKARFIGEGIFAQIHQIRKAGATSVSEALELIDD